MMTRTNHVLLAATLFAMTGGLLSAQGAEVKEVKPPTVTELIERLGDDSYKVRRDAEQALRAQGSAATEALRKAAESHDDAEVKWRAKRLLRQAEGTDTPGLAPRVPRDDRAPGGGRLGQGPDQDIGSRFDRLFEQLERDFGTQLPRAKFFGGDFFQDIEARMDEMRRNSTMLQQSGQGFSMSVDGDGVRVQVTEQGEGGKSDTKTYEAPDLETFRAKYPKVAEQYLDGGGVRMFTFGPGARLNLRPGSGGGLSPRGLVAPLPGPGGVPGVGASGDDRDRLGVYVEAVPEAVRDFLGLPAGVGLRVQSVVEDSLAAQAGVEAGDILLEVAGRGVASPEDVRGALHALDGGSEFDVKVNRRGEARALHARTPVREKAEGGKAEGAAEKDAAPGLRKRAIR